jgi:protein ImuA
MHEVSGASADMFAIQVAAAQDQPVLWIGLRRDIVTLNPTGLQAWLKVEDLILVEAVSRGELLWAADQALRASGGFCVILDMPDTLSLKESRRLQLAAEQGGGIGLLLLRGPASTSAAQTRWACEPCCTEQPSWDWTCLKGKNGEAGRWRMTGQARGGEGGACAKDTLHLAAAASA